MNKQYTTRRAESANDAAKLNELFSDVFYPEDVGTLAETMFHHLPGMERRYWFIAEETKTGRIVSAFALIPWTWEMGGVKLKVAEMGIVGTLESHRGRGLMRILNGEFDKTLADEGFDLAAIQGIPGFYQQFDYFYSVPLENQINLPLHIISEEQQDGGYSFRQAGQADIPFLMAEDECFRQAYSLSAYRDEAHWRYLLTESQQTEYGSEFLIGERDEHQERFYCRIPQEGFGAGLIVSEISEDISIAGQEALFSFLKQRAGERDKPYIRLNLHNDSPAGKTAVALGAKPGTPYAWQIKIPDPGRLLRTIGPVLERRLQASSFKGYSGRFRLNFYKFAVDLLWVDGHLESVAAAEGQSDHSLSLPVDLFPVLCLGHRSRQELRHIRPDVIAGSDSSALLVDVLFPPAKSWIHEQY